MSIQIPVSIRRHFSVKTEKDKWILKCDVCDKGYSLERPKKGEKIHGGNILELLNHAAGHPIAEEAAEEPAEEESVKVEPVVSVPKEEPKPTLSTEPVRHVSIKHTLPSPEAPNCYKVEMIGHSTKVSHFRDPTFKDHRVVRKTETGYTVVLFAANQRHASMVAARLIDKYRANQ